MNFRAIRVILYLIYYFSSTAPLRRRLRALEQKDPKKAQEIAFASVQKAINHVIRICGVDVTVEGKENIPDEAVLFVGNHTSYFDIVTLLHVSDRPLGFVAKKELRSIPGLSGWMERIHCLFLDRNDLKQGFATIMEGVESLKSGYSMCVYPEGTRSKTGELGEFHAGSLKMAQRSKSPVVPVAVSGTRDIYENNKGFVLTPAHVKISFGSPFVITDLPKEERKFASDKTKQAIADLLDQM